MEENLVSIIVPVYNVENYIDDCVKSLVSQTYKNIEIILIDDGSTDKSGGICDEYALDYDRVKVFHKENGGLSDARNYGLTKIEGEYVCFVDSDDYVEPNFVYELMSAVEKYSVDIACVRWKATKATEQLKIPCTGETKLLDSQTVLKEMVSPIDYGITVSVWDRIYKRDIIAGLSFPKGKCYEDILFSTNAIIRANKIAYIDKELYVYRVRVGSITRPTEGLLDKRIITDKLFHEMKQIELVKDKGFLDVYQYYRLLYYYEILSVYVSNPYEEYKSQLKNYIDVIEMSVTSMIKVKMNYKLKIWVILQILIIKAGIIKNDIFGRIHSFKG